MEKIRNMSLRKTILLYTVVSLIGMYLLAPAIIKIAEETQNNIWSRYIDENKYLEILEKKGIDVVIPRPASSVMSKSDYEVSEFCDFLETYTILILSVIGNCVAVWLFYRDKLKDPIVELEQASKNISENNLDFHITYENRDEMGHLCHEFERMREQLAQNNQRLWENIESEKALRAAIAHDIRSPLSVLKGYHEMLLEYLPDGIIDMDKTIEMLSVCMRQTERMDAFVETMRKISSLEQRELLSEEITGKQLKADLELELKVLERSSTKQCVLQVSTTEEIFCGDKEVILEVVENLLSNALRYSKKQVEITVQVTHLELIICVSDDGNGFGESAEKITKVFHQQNVKDSLKHTGMGMYISRLYCEKHGGKLLLENNENHGAEVTAVFHRIV